MLVEKEEFEQKKVKLDRDNLPTINGVPFQINQLPFNIINNSIKYTHPDRNAPIQIRYESVNSSDVKEWCTVLLQKFHKISIIDNGIGFGQQHACKLPFYSYHLKV